MAPRVFYLVRHGETDWNAAERWQGQTDVPLNATGRGQARTVGTGLRGVAFARVVSSDLTRAQETAQIVAAELGIEGVSVDAALRERSFGCFEGLTRGECEQRHPQAWSAWLEKRRPPDGAETHEALTSRAVGALARWAAAEMTEEGPILVVSHGGTIRAVVAAATGALPAPVRNGAIWRVGWQAGPAWAHPLP